MGSVRSLTVGAGAQKGKHASTLRLRGKLNRRIDMVVSKRKLFARPDSYSLFIRKFFRKIASAIYLLLVIYRHHFLPITFQSSSFFRHI